MAEPKKHKEEKPNAKEKTPQEKKIRQLRKEGHSLNEIAQKLNIPRKVAEKPFSDDLVKKGKGKSREQLQREADDREDRSLEKGRKQQEAKDEVAKEKAKKGK